MRILLSLICCLLLNDLRAQSIDSSQIELSGMHYMDSIEKKCYFLSTPRDSIDGAAITNLPFSSVLYGKKSVPDSFMERDCFVKFTIHNSEDTAREVCFVPGYYLKTFRVYAANPANIRQTFAEVPEDSEKVKLFPSCKLLMVPAHESRVYFGKFTFLRTNVNSYSPRIIEKKFLWSFVMLSKSRNAYINLITYMATGVLLLMIIYSLGVYAQNKQREYLYYSAYTFCVGILLFLKTFLDLKTTPFNLFFEEYLDLMIICSGVFFYLAFIRKFLNTGSRDVFLEKMIRYSAAALLVLMIIFSFYYFFTDRYIILNILENFFIKMVLFLLGIIVIIYSVKKKDPLLNYLAAGNIALVFFSMVSLGMMLFGWRFYPAEPGSVFNRSFLYYQLGLVSELALFLFGLAYKNKVDIISQVKEREKFKLDTERREFEKQMAMMAVRQEERDRISADMHDDLGSGVTAIRLMSEIVKSKMKTENLPEIDKISSSANELLGKMNSIIWTMKSSNDTLESLVAYLRAFATEYFDGTLVECTVGVNIGAEREMSGEKRRNIFLSFKETLNNILKHAKATRVDISIIADAQKLVVSIRDNGVGIDLKNLRRFGNGLNNIKKRMQSINGDFVIGHDNGTLVCLEVALDSD